MAIQNDPPDDLYDIAPQASPPASVPRQVIPVISATKPHMPDYRARAVEKSAKFDAERIKNFQMPIWLLSAGVLIEIAATFFRKGTAAQAMQYVALELVLGTIIMLIGILIAAKLRQIDLGNFWTAVFKLSAISVAPSAVIDLANPALQFIPFGFLIGLLIEFILYFALLGAMFDMDESDTWYCVWTIFLVRVAVYILIIFVGPKI